MQIIIASTRRNMFFAQRIRWLGRRISQYLIRYDPRRIDRILSMSAPVTDAQLQQFSVGATVGQEFHPIIFCDNGAPPSIYGTRLCTSRKTHKACSI